jgi:hypothetical protein
MLIIKFELLGLMLDNHNYYQVDSAFCIVMRLRMKWSSTCQINSYKFDPYAFVAPFSTDDLNYQHLLLHYQHFDQ